MLLRKIIYIYRGNHMRYTSILCDKVQCLLMLQQMVHIVTSVKQVSTRISTKKCVNSHLTYWYGRYEAPGTCNAVCHAADNVITCQGQTSELCCVGLQTVQRTGSMATLQLVAVSPRPPLWQHPHIFISS